MNKMFKFFVSKRVLILSVIGVFVYVLVSLFHISLWYILLFGIITGVIFGKVFCRWGCPMGLIMELIMSLNKDGKLKSMYMYHKMGCPIAWISGWLNRYSFFKIKLNADSCKNCGMCDKECYIVAMEPVKYSLYKTKMSNPGDSYTCSKCLKCVISCPNGSLKYKL